ncbi:dnaJ domain-containing protein [Ditylenchus destructor]|nr:dnaJ domain-containing protein [Ditylenchus destructor]
MRNLKLHSSRMEPKDYYKILGIQTNASSREIKNAYYSLARIYHPDKNMQRQDTAALFNQISEAYNVLSSMEQRTMCSPNGNMQADAEKSCAPEPRAKVILGSKPTIAECPKCKTLGFTKIKHKPSDFAWTWCEHCLCSSIQIWLKKAKCTEGT